MQKRFVIVFLLLIWFGFVHGQGRILFDATKAEMAANADWIVDADVRDIGTGNGGLMIVGAGNESNPARYPTPLQFTLPPDAAETFWDGALSAMAVEIARMGHQIETLPVDGSITFGDAGNPQDLSHYDVFVVCEPNLPFTAAEREAILQFIYQGGGLLMIGNHYGADRNGDGTHPPQIWNQLMNENSFGVNVFGIQFDLNSVSGTSGSVAADPNDPILHGVAGDVNAISYHSGATMTINPTANPTVVALAWLGSGQGNSSVMLARAQFGQGRVVGVGDSSPADDGTGDPSDNLYNGWTEPGVQNNVMFTNALLWLLQPPYHADQTAPVMLNAPQAQLIGNDVQVTWETDELSTSQMIYGNSHSLADTLHDLSLVTEHSLIISTPPAGQTIYFRCRSLDPFGNASPWSPLDSIFVPGNPVSISLAGWTLQQFNSSQTFTFPVGTELTGGNYLIVTRNASRADFEANIKPLPPATVFINSNNGIPKLNGGEYFVLYNAQGEPVDSTITLAGTGQSMQRIHPGQSGTQPQNWLAVADTGCTPGYGITTSENAGVVISEFTDIDYSWLPLRYNYEFVELYFDAEVTSIENKYGHSAPPENFRILSVYPNPFNQEFHVSLQMAVSMPIRIELFNLLGQPVATLFENHLTAGEHRLAFQTENFATGVYFFIRHRPTNAAGQENCASEMTTLLPPMKTTELCP